MRRLIVGIDPGTGSSSACGLAAFEMPARKIVYANAIWAKKYQKPTVHRIKDVVEQVEAQVGEFVTKYGAPAILVGIESFVMRGKGGETLQRMIGATLTRLPYDLQFIEIQNTSMKKWVGKTGTADKARVAEGVARFFEGNGESAYIVKKLIDTDQWDVLDALGLGITALEGGRK